MTATDFPRTTPLTDKAKHPAAFPRLDAPQMAEIARLAEAKSYRDGETLFHAGEREFRFHVLRSGAIVILDQTSAVPGGDGRPVVLVVQDLPGEFTGDVANLAGRPANASAVARGDTEVYELTAERLRTLLAGNPGLSDVILAAFIARERLLIETEAFVGVRVIGSRFCGETHRIREFLARNRMLYSWQDLEESPETHLLLEQFQVRPEDTPVVVRPDGLLLRAPSLAELADQLGIRQPLTERLYDVVIVGAGPPGLGAAVYSASEGLSTLVLDGLGPGGQAGNSSKIENYLGFPTGVSGAELANRAVLQAGKFGAHLSSPSRVESLEFTGDGGGNLPAVVRLEGGERVTARCLVLATGADYRRLPAEGCDTYEGVGVFYAATIVEANMCRNSTVLVVGGGNSAGQAAMFLSTHARQVYVVVRGANLAASMSTYLSRRLEEAPNVELLFGTEVRRLTGNGSSLESVEIEHAATKARRTLAASAVFCFLGADPRTGWLPPEIERDEKGFIKTGLAVAGSPRWGRPRQPFPLETSRPGVFAAGDARLGSIKRVASAIGEGAMAVELIHEYLKEG